MYSNDAQGSRSRRKIQHRNSYDKMTKNISDVSQAGGAAISVLGATGLGLALEAKNTTTKSVKVSTPPTNRLVKNYFKDTLQDAKGFAKKTIKTMGKLSPVGLVTSIMAPKKVGDATLKGNERQFKKDYGNT